MFTRLVEKNLQMYQLYTASHKGFPTSTFFGIFGANYWHACVALFNARLLRYRSNINLV